MRRLQIAIVVGLIASVALAVPSASAAENTNPTGDPAFHRTWARTDFPVKNGNAVRTWMWGARANSPFMYEPYDQSPDGRRVVIYFDKSRMEITHPDAVDDGVWYVSNGLLVLELIRGQIQVGDDRFLPSTPAQIPVAGDPNDADGPTYATFQSLLDEPPLAENATIIQRVDRVGNVTQDNSLAGNGITATQFVPETNHRVAAPFWQFMNSSGTVYSAQTRQITTDNLFVNPFYATGYPVTEAYWTTVLVGGSPQLVLLQCFQRRCLTYNPANAPEWRTEAGNVGLHYFSWRYPTIPRPVPVQAVPLEGEIVYQPDMSTLPTFDDGVSRVYYDAALSSYVVENRYPAVNVWSAVVVYFPPSGALVDYSISLDIVQLSQNASSFSEAGLWTRFGPLDPEGTQLQAAFTGYDTNGYVGSWYLGASSQNIREYERAPETNSGYLSVNNLKVIVKGGHGWAFVNGVFVHEFDLPEGANTAHDGFGLIVYNLTEEVDDGIFGFRNLILRDLE